MNEQTCTKCGWAGMVATCQKCGGAMKAAETPQAVVAADVKRKVSFLKKR